MTVSLNQGKILEVQTQCRDILKQYLYLARTWWISFIHYLEISDTSLINLTIKYQHKLCMHKSNERCILRLSIICDGAFMNGSVNNFYKKALCLTEFNWFKVTQNIILLAGKSNNTNSGFCSTAIFKRSQYCIKVINKLN